MSDEERFASPPWWRKLSEDWLAVIVGAVLIGLVMLGVLSGIPW